MEPKKYNNMNLASPVMRILATLVDGILTSIVGAVVVIPFGIASSLALPAASDLSNPASYSALVASQGVGIVGGILSLAVWAIFYLVFPIYVWKGQTIGKKLLKLRIVNAAGKPAEQMDVLKRYSIYIGTGILALIPFVGGLSGCVNFVVVLVNLVMLFTDEARQTLLDKVGQTYVVTEE